MRKLIRQALRFFLISGLGWLIDFSVYWLLTSRGGQVGYSNFISAIPAVTFVFFTSTRKTFIHNQSRFRLRTKYLIYLAYQFLLLVAVSAAGQALYGILAVHVVQPVILRHLKIIVKILITPITMTVNFIVMKALVEKA